MKKDFATLLVLLFIVGGLAKGSKKAMTSVQRRMLAELRDLAARVGFPDPATAAAVAMAESSGNPDAANIVSPAQAKAYNASHSGPRHGPERSFGLWQVNTLTHPQYKEAQLADPLYNAKAALEISQGGKNWSAWSTFNDGSYKRFLTAAA